MKLWTRRLLQGLSIASLGVVGCAQEREPISQVQPQALEKTFFVGKLNDDCDNPEFFSKAFVIDQTAGQNGLSVGLYSGKDRIRWEVTEDYLTARKSYQIAQGQDHHGVPGSCQINGVVVAKYKITSHFDIKRAYNPQTGEELNVITENTSDRPWHERKYMRVDWSTNQVNDPMWDEIFIGKVFGDLKVEPLTYTVTDPKSDDAPYFDAKDGYFDVTNKYYVAPAETHAWGITIPTCALVGLYTSTTTNDCNAQEATVRHSFWKVDPNNDFEPMENTFRNADVIANFAGAGSSFTPAYAGGVTQCWDPQYAYTEACFHQYMNKHNLWVKSHVEVACTSNDDLDNNGTADACASASQIGGSQCDMYYKKCTIPLRERAIKAVGWWLNKETPLELMDAVDEAGNFTGPADPSGEGVPQFRGPMEDVVKSWNQVMMVALAFGREAECRSTGGDRASCHDQFFVTNGGVDVTQMIAFGGWGIQTPKAQPQDAKATFITCHAPVRPYDNQEVCGKTGEIARNGDQRKNFIYYWPYDSDARYGGVAGLNQDPETGEQRGATATVMGRSATRAAANYRDYIQVAMGDFSVDDITEGVPQWVFNKIMANGYSPDSDFARKARGEIPQYVDSKAQGSTARKTEATKPGLTAGYKPTLDKSIKAEMKARLTAQRESGFNQMAQNQTQPLWEAAAEKLRGTKFEATIVDSTWAMQTTGANPNSPVDETGLEASSPFRGLDPGRMASWKAQIAGKLANKGVCYMEDIPRVGSINFVGMVQYYLDQLRAQGKTGDIDSGGPRDPALVKERGEIIYRDLFKGMATGIAIHEMGHCIGMRHNFASSYDAPNYMPQYWQLRTNEGQSDGVCTGPRDPNSPDTCMGARFNDPETLDEQGLAPGNGRPGVTYFGNTSVMEYEQDYMSPGMGTYDVAYAKAVYGGVLETYDIDASPDAGGIPEDQQGNFLLNLGLQRSEIATVNDGYAHYTGLARELKVFKPSYCRPATPEEQQQGTWRVVHGQICGQSPRDHAFWRDMLDDEEGGYVPPTAAAGWGWAFTAWHSKPDASGRSRHRWNYRYGETYGHGYAHTNPSDAGADVYEVSIGNSKMFDLTYPLTYFRRGNKEYFYDAIPSRTADQYFERARSFHWLLEGTPPMGNPELDESYARAAGEAFYILQRAALTPEPGPMKFYQTTGVWDADANDAIQAPATFQVSLIDGRYASDEFNDFKGGQWDYLSWIDHAGFNSERFFAIRALLDGRPTLYTISRETAIDGRNVMKNYRVDQASGVDRLIGGIMSEDWETTAMWVKDDIPAGADQLPYRSPQLMNLLDANPTRPAGSQPVFPNLAYKSQIATMAYAYLYGTMNSDISLTNKLAIYIEGIDFIGAIPDTELVKFHDPVSGYTYVARSFGTETINGKTVDKGIGSRMLQRANALIAANPPEDSAVRKYVGVIDDTRAIGKLYGLIRGANVGSEG